MVIQRFGVLVIVFVVAFATASPPTVHAQDDVTWLLNQINVLRAGLGLHTYALNAQLSAAATQHSQYMADTCHISHVEANGSRPVDRARANGYTGNWISENIYGGGIARAVDAWNFWVNSPIHYQGLTHQVVNEIGIGVVRGGCGNYFTLLFGHRADVTAPPAPVPAADPAGDSGPAPPPPTPVPYVPPPPTSTPTPTIITMTPSATWTLTPTHTATPLATRILPTLTPLVLPTVSAPDESPVSPIESSPEQGEGVAMVPTVEEMPSSPPLTPTAQPVTRGEVNSSGAGVVHTDEGGFETRELIPYAIVGQIVLIGLAGFAYFRRSR